MIPRALAVWLGVILVPARLNGRIRLAQPDPRPLLPGS